MKSIQIFESISFNKSNSNAADTNQQLLNFADEAKWAEQNAIQIERFTIEQQPEAFDNCPVVKDFLKGSGQAALPLILVDGESILSGRYPNRVELTKWSQLFQPVIELKPISGCCSGGNCG
jgi:hypothetical protein